MKANVATDTFFVPLFHVLRHYALLYRIKRDFQARNITESNPGYHILLWIHVAFMAKGSVCLTWWKWFLGATLGLRPVWKRRDSSLPRIILKFNNVRSFLRNVTPHAFVSSTREERVWHMSPIGQRNSLCGIHHLNRTPELPGASFNSMSIFSPEQHNISWHWAYFYVDCHFELPISFSVRRFFFRRKRRRRPNMNT